MPVRIKICGIQTVKDLQAAIQAGADAVGLNFYKKSVRFIHFDQVRDIVHHTPPGVSLVGVFANPSDDELVEVIKNAPEIGCFQFHGRLPYLRLLDSRKWIAVASASAETSIKTLQKEIDQLVQNQPIPSAILVDTKIDGLMGGTGVAGPWNIINKCLFPIPLILAGGLTASNVQEAIKTVNPYMVDVASGVESIPGVKCPIKMTSFAEQVFHSY